MNNQPNVILCICDQLRAFEVGCYGNPVIRTPNIDRLASGGVRFEHAVTNNPVCMPARAALLSGQHARTCMGDLNNTTETDSRGRTICAAWPVDARVHLPNTTLVEALKAAGYDTALIGKWHVHPAPQLLGFDQAIYPRANHRHTAQTFVRNGGEPELVDGFSVEFESECVLRFLAEPRDRPFFLYYSISPPHMPLADAPQKYLTMYSPDEVVLRQNVFVDGEMAHSEEWFRIYLWDFLYYAEKMPHTLELPAGFDLRNLTAMYYGLTTWVDDMVGTLMAGLRNSGLADNTIVVFTSDHGDNLGSHHKFNKNDLIDESIRVPLIFHAPTFWPTAVNHAQVAQIVDIMPTLLDACGCGSSVQGRNLVPILSGACEQIDQNWGVIETDGNGVGVRTRTHLYGLPVERENREPGARIKRSPRENTSHFYDLRADPYQLDNLATTRAQPQVAFELDSLLRAWDADTPWMGKE